MSEYIMQAIKELQTHAATCSRLAQSDMYEGKISLARQWQEDSARYSRLIRGLMGIEQ